MYLNVKIINSQRQALSRSSHMLQIEAGRHKNLLMADCAFSVKNYILLFQKMNIFF